MNLAEHVLRAGQAVPDHQALVVMGADDAQVWTHGDLRRAVLGTAMGLTRAGLRPGDRLLMRLANRPAFPIAYLGAIAAGVIPVPTSAQLTGAEITRIAARIAPAMIVAGAGVPLPDHPAPVLTEGDLDGIATLPPADFAQGSADRLAYIVFTSGSSGQPRAVMHAHRAILARQAMMQGWYGLRAEDRLLHAGAFNWTFTLGTGLLDPWTLGATALIPADGTPIERIPLLAARHGATILAGAPGVFRRMLRAPFPDLPHLRHGLSAGEKLAEPLRDAWERATGTALHEAYGMSECSTFVSGSPARPAPEGAAGYVQPGRSAWVEGDRLMVGPDDPGLMLGYWEDGAPRPVAGPFDTGDRVRPLPDGAIVHEGRRDDLLNPGGHRVSPQEVEAALAGLPVTELAVGCVETASGATILAAFYAGPPLDEAAADAHAAARLAAYKRPRAWLRRDALPRNANGKLIRRDLA